MENFFNDVFEYNIFKRALKATEAEPVVISKQATDASLKQKSEPVAKIAPVQHKNMSDKFEPSPFGRYFGSRKKRTTPLDMSDFSSWKNKNYRKVEETTEDDKPKQTFSLSEYMKSKSLQKFNELDQAKSDLKKPITQLSPEDPDLKKYALDSYMHKLEGEVIAEDKFRENDDLLEPILNFDENAMASSAQDEDFNANGNNIENFAFDDENTMGDEFVLDQNELEEVRKRLEILERETNKFKQFAERETEHDVSEQSSFSAMIEEDKTNDASTTSNEFQETRIVNQEDQSENKVEMQENVQQEVKDTEKLEINDTAKEITRTIGKEKIAPKVIQEKKQPENEDIKNAMTLKRKPTVKVSRTNLLTEDEHKTMTDDFMSQFSKNNKKVTVSDLKSQSELEAKIAALTFENKKKTTKVEVKPKSDDSFKKELKSNYNISNLEMDNKLLKISNRIKKEEEKNKVDQVKVQVEPNPASPKPASSSPKTISKSSATKKKRGKSRRRIDGDIIGEIDFD